MILKKGDQISFKKSSETWKKHPSHVWEVDYVNPGCQDLKCGHDDCSREPFVVARQNIYYGLPLKDVDMIFVDHVGQPFKGD
jgi:hypothetical protein